MKEGTKNILREVGLNKQVDRVEHGFCPLCANPVSVEEFKDELSKKEYVISGMCAACQADVFKEED